LDKLGAAELVVCFGAVSDPDVALAFVMSQQILFDHVH
jgi:hypothetical protein